MAHIVDLGRRIELVPIDPYFHEITIALYHQQHDAGAPSAFVVHSYSARAGTEARIDFVRRAMQVLGGMTASTAGPDRLQFPCGQKHQAAAKRTFLEACKLAPETEFEARPLSIFDKKSARTIRVDSAGGGAYHVAADGDDEDGARRAAAVAAGLIKLAEMEPLDARGRVGFDCGHAHDALVGLLLVRALNVRSALRDELAKAARGILAAPSAQEG